MIRILGIIALVAALGACDLGLEALTAAPVGGTAELNVDCKEIKLSRGAALAVACTAGGELCDDMSVQVGDDTIAGARVAFRNALDLTWEEGPQPATSFVIFGKAAGLTSVTVDSSNGSVTYDVRVVE